MRALGLDFRGQCPACGANDSAATGYCARCGSRLDESTPAIADPEGAFLEEDVYLAYAGWPLPPGSTITRSREQWMVDVRIMGFFAGFVCLMLGVSGMYIETIVLALIVFVTTVVVWATGRAGAEDSHKVSLSNNY